MKALYSKELIRPYKKIKHCKHFLPLCFFSPLCDVDHHVNKMFMWLSWTKKRFQQNIKILKINENMLKCHVFFQMRQIKIHLILMVRNENLQRLHVIMEYSKTHDMWTPHPCGPPLLHRLDNHISIRLPFLMILIYRYNDTLPNSRMGWYLIRMST